MTDELAGQVGWQLLVGASPFVMTIAVILVGLALLGLVRRW